MKIRHLLTGLAIMVSFMAASAFTALAAPTEEYSFIPAIILRPGYCLISSIVSS